MLNKTRYQGKVSANYVETNGQIKKAVIYINHDPLNS